MPQQQLHAPQCPGRATAARASVSWASVSWAARASVSWASNSCTRLSVLGLSALGCTRLSVLSEQQLHGPQCPGRATAARASVSWASNSCTRLSVLGLSVLGCTRLSVLGCTRLSVLGELCAHTKQHDASTGSPCMGSHACPMPVCHLPHCRGLPQLAPCHRCPWPTRLHCAHADASDASPPAPPTGCPPPESFKQQCTRAWQSDGILGRAQGKGKDPTTPSLRHNCAPGTSLLAASILPSPANVPLLLLLLLQWRRRRRRRLRLPALFKGLQRSCVGRATFVHTSALRACGAERRMQLLAQILLHAIDGPGVPAEVLSGVHGAMRQLSVCVCVCVCVCARLRMPAVHALCVPVHACMEPCAG